MIQSLTPGMARCYTPDCSDTYQDVTPVRAAQASLNTIFPMLTVHEALAAILQRVSPLPSIRVPLTDALGRVLAEDIAADIDNPAFDNSAVDGHAVLAANTAAATKNHPVPLRDLGDVPAGSLAA